MSILLKINQVISMLIAFFGGVKIDFYGGYCIIGLSFLNNVMLMEEASSYVI